MSRKDKNKKTDKRLDSGKINELSVRIALITSLIELLTALIRLMKI